MQLRDACSTRANQIMTAADTNVVVRLLTGDHPIQSSAARLLFASGPVWIARTAAPPDMRPCRLPSVKEFYYRGDSACHEHGLVGLAAQRKAGGRTAGLYRLRHQRAYESRAADRGQSGR